MTVSKNEAIWKLGNAIREAIDQALDDGLSLAEAREEIAYQSDNYDEAV